jgi:hypothetical protein
MEAMSRAVAGGVKNCPRALRRAESTRAQRRFLASSAISNGSAAVALCSNGTLKDSNDIMRRAHRVRDNRFGPLSLRTLYLSSQP